MYLICLSWMNQMMSQFFNMNSRHVLFVLGWSVWEQCYKWWGAYWGSTLMGGRTSMTSGWTVSPQTCTPWDGARSWTTVWKDQGSKVSYYSPRSCFQNNYFHECIYLGTFSFADKILSSIDACIYSNCICQRYLVHVHIQRKLLIQFLVTLYLNDFSGTSSANYANTQNVKRAEETQG